MTSTIKGGAVRLEGLATAPWARPLDAEHVDRLATAGNWPPIVVTPEGIIIDGRHRVEAAKVLRREAVACTLAEGPLADLLVLAIKGNQGHGLPWDRDARMTAARQLLVLRSDWSNGRIAALCGVPQRAVSELRDLAACPSAELDTCDVGGNETVQRRVGLDGKARPVDPEAVRAQIAGMLDEDPAVGVEEIRSRTGACRTTIGKVRREWRSRQADHVLEREELRAQTLARLELQRQAAVTGLASLASSGHRKAGARVRRRRAGDQPRARNRDGRCRRLQCSATWLRRALLDLQRRLG